MYVCMYVYINMHANTDITRTIKFTYYTTVAYTDKHVCMMLE